MVFFGRRKLTCFYCSQQCSPPPSTAHHLNGRVSYFVCPHCRAENHLDATTGEILDPTPPDASDSNLQFARRAATFSTGEEVIFCRKCQINQNIVREALANWPQGDKLVESRPDYDYWVNEAEKHRKTLEERFPPLCANCAPKVRSRINESNYFAKTAALGRGLARTSATRTTPRERKGKRGLLKTAVWYSRGTVWCLMHVLVLAWHGTAAVHPSNAGVEDGPMGWGRCVMRSLSRMEMDAACTGVAANCARLYIPYGILGFFWVYRERDKERYPERRIVGGKEYLTIESLILVLRMASWWLLAPGGVLEFFGDDALRRIHMAMFLLSLVAALSSATCLKLEDPPTFNLRETEPFAGSRLATPPPSPPSPPAAAYAPPIPRPTTPPALTSGRQLRPRPPRPPPPQPRSRTTRSTREITPAYRNREPSISLSTEAGDDEMDWDPSTPTRAESPWRPRDASSPSPFVGNLPPAPLAKPIFSAANGGFAAIPARDETTTVTPPRGTEWEKLTNPSHRLTSPQWAPMAPARFQIEPETTGLEGLFGPSLRISDQSEANAAEAEAAMWNAEPESLVELSARAMLVGLASALAWTEGGPHNGAIAALVLGVVATWAGVKTDGPAKIVGAVEALVAGALAVAMGMAGWHLLGFVRIAVVFIGMGEVWSGLMRARRARTRRFWQEESRKAREEETARLARITADKRPSRTSLGFGGLGL